MDLPPCEPAAGDPWQSFDNWLVKNNMVDQWWNADEEEVIQIIEEWNAESEVGNLFAVGNISEGTICVGLRK